MISGDGNDYIEMIKVDNMYLNEKACLRHGDVRRYNSIARTLSRV